MLTDLRKVTFTIDCQPDFNPDEEQQEWAWRDGFFHTWGHVEEMSPQSGKFREKDVALIEDAETGAVYSVDITLFKFVHE